MATYTLTFQLSTPICVDSYGIMLDSLLLNAKLGALGGMRATDEQLRYANSELDLLFNRCDLGLRRVSLAFYDVIAEGTGLMCKRFGIDDAAELTNADRVITNKGKFKNGMAKPVELLAKEIYFHLDTSSPDEVAVLAAQVMGIGKHVARGFGEVGGWQMALGDNAVWQSIIRPIPRRLLSTTPKRVQYRTFEPPYWDMSRAEICAVDGTF